MAGRQSKLYRSVNRGKAMYQLAYWPRSTLVSFPWDVLKATVRPAPNTRRCVLPSRSLPRLIMKVKVFISWWRIGRVFFRLALNRKISRLSFVDDGSTDNTWKILSQLAQTYPSVKPCRHAVNQGAGAALTTAINHTTKSWVFLLDSDGQYPVDNLDLFLQEMGSTPVPAYIGYRLEKADSAFARFGSWISGKWL